MREPLRFLVRGSSGLRTFLFMEYDMEEKKTCCFFGHRKIAVADGLRERLYKIIEDLIVNKNVITFLFGSKSDFDKLCLDVVTKLKEKNPHINRVYVRAEFQHIDDDYKAYLLQRYEETYYPESISGSGRAVYVERNQIMIESSNICIVYYDENYHPQQRKNNNTTKSGTKIAYEYANKKNKEIINLI